MDPAKKSLLLKRMLAQVAPAEVVESPLSGLGSLGFSEAQAEAVKRGLDQLADAMGPGRPSELDHRDEFAVEAIIHKRFRPAVYIVADSYDSPPAPWEHLGSPEIQQRILPGIPSIGRVELPGIASVPFGGTGFVVGPNLLMTNRHVAELFASGLGTRQLVFKSHRSAAMNFRREVVPTTQVRNVQVQRVVMIHPYWDMALLQVDALTPAHAPLRLSIKHPADLAERDVVVIGYPAQDSRNALDLQNEIFGGVFNVKRLQPGKLKEVRKIESFGNFVDAVTHDASTLGGNSGSAVIDVATGEVVALHFAGSYLDANFAVPTYELARDARVVDSGVSFTGSVAATSAWAWRWQVADEVSEAVVPAGRLLAATPVASAVPPAPSTASPAPSPATAPVPNAAVTWTVPLQVTVAVGQPAIAIPAGAELGAAGALPAAPLARAAVAEPLAGEAIGAESQTVATAYARFSADSLTVSAFSWSAALSCAAASHLAYADAVRVIDVGRNQWSFATCDFVQVNDTECFVASDANLVLISFRGTASTADWIRDLTFFSTEVEYGTVHRGFYAGFRQVQSQLEALLTSASVSTKQLVITGHSLGGALATIAAAEWNSRYSIRSVYTFGQPAVGKRDFRDFMNHNFAGRFQRLVNGDDMVARVPPGYVHIGKLVHLGPQATVSSESARPTHRAEEEMPMLNEVEFRILQQECAAISSVGRAEAVRAEGLLSSFRDHYMFRYIAKILEQIA